MAEGLTMKEKLALFNKGSDGDISPSNNKLRTTPTKSKETTPSPPRSPPPPPVVTPPSPKQQPKPVSPSSNIIKSNVSFNKIDSNTTTNTNSAADSKSGDTYEDDQEFKSIKSEKQTTIIDNNKEKITRRLSKAQMQFASALDKTLADGPPPSPAARRKSRLSLEQEDDNISNNNSSNTLGVIPPPPPPPPQKRDSKSTPLSEAPPPRSGTPTTSMETDSIDKSEEDNKALAHVSLLILPLINPSTLTLITPLLLFISLSQRCGAHQLLT